jgi:hypothetical protein
MSRKKLGIIVPYRDRPGQVRNFVKEINQYFATIIKDFSYQIYIVEQGDKKEFNRGKLLNIGFISAEKDSCDYVIFHDIDMLPYNVDYSYNDFPLQLANKFEASSTFSRTINDDYFGGVTLFPVRDFRKINGYSNRYRGWGFEDNDLLYRCEKNNIKLDTKTYRVYSEETKALKFNGSNSYVEVPNRFSYARPLTFFASFNPSNIKCDKNEITDEYAIFSVPGEDLNLSYNSFRTYKFEIFLINSDIISLTSKTLPNLPARAVITVDPKSKLVKFYLNGLKVGQDTWEKYGFKKYNTEPYLYLGVGNPNRKKKQKWFNGTIDEFAVYNKVLTEQEIRAISTKQGKKLTDSFNRYDSNENLEMYYRAEEFDLVDIEDSKKINLIRGKKTKQKVILRDLSGNSNYATTHNITVIDTPYQGSVGMKVPYRRTGKYKLIPHEEQGYTSGYWKNWKSRENQLRYYDIINNNKEEYLEDGLSNCKYKILHEENSSLGTIYKIKTKILKVRT